MVKTWSIIGIQPYKSSVEPRRNIVGYSVNLVLKTLFSMKVAICLLVLLPLALSAPLTVEQEEIYKRFIFGHVQLPSVNDLGQEIISLLGSDTSEAACESACPAALNALIPGGSLIGGSLCGPACHWVQGQING